MTPADRARQVAHALRLEYLTVGWNVLEAAVAIVAALRAGSIALLGFGADSVVESLSGLILIVRLRADAAARDAEAVRRLDQRAHRAVGGTLFALAAYVGWEAANALARHETPSGSPLGIALTVVSMGVMLALARAKRRAARALGSRALEADAFQTSACWWLSVIALGGVGLNTALGWWWADPVAALGMIPILVREGREAWRGEACSCHADVPPAG